MIPQDSSSGPKEYTCKFSEKKSERKAEKATPLNEILINDYNKRSIFIFLNIFFKLQTSDMSRLESAATAAWPRGQRLGAAAR